MAQQTAVEWLIEQVQNRQNGVIKDFPILSLDQIFEQAKAIEKEQIIEASHIMYMNGTTKYPITAEQYYNETYGGDNAKGNS
jgi:antirestriction protein